MSAQMAHLAQHDFLTDLPNRLLLRDRLRQAIASARRRRTAKVPVERLRERAARFFVAMCDPR
jgi:GGDEF domain-containing protein